MGEATFSGAHQSIIEYYIYNAPKKFWCLYYGYVKITNKQNQLTFFQCFICLLTLKNRKYILNNVLNIF